MLGFPRFLILPASLLLLSTTAAADPVPLGPPSLVPAPYAQTPVALAANGNGYAAIWSDTRSTIELPRMLQFPAFYVAALDANGVPADPRGHRIDNAAYGVAIVANGSGYLVAYGNGAGFFTQALHADGTPAAAPIKVLAAPPNYGAPQGGTGLATNGSTFLLVTGAFGNGGKASASILGADGSVVHTMPIEAFNSISQIWVLPNGAYQFIVLRWYCNGVTPCAFVAVLTSVTEDGAVSENLLVTLPQRTSIGATYAGGEILLVNASDGQTGDTFEARLFATNGAPLRPALQIDAQPFCGCYMDAPTAGWDGRQFLVAYPRQVDASTWEDRAVRVTADGLALDATPLVLDSGGTPPLMATNGSTTVLLSASGSWAARDVVSRSVYSFDVLANAPQHVVAQSAALERDVQVAPGPKGALAVWREGFPNPSIAGSIGGGTPFTIAPAGPLDLQAPAAARGGDAFLVAWREQQKFPNGNDGAFRILARRISVDGVPLDPQPIVVATDEGLVYTPDEPTIAVASDGTGWLVVYPGQNTSMRAVRVAANGAVLDAAPVELEKHDHFPLGGSPHAVWSGSRYIVAWTENLDTPGLGVALQPMSDIYVARLTAAGQLLDSKQVWVGDYGDDVAFAAAPGRLLLAWNIEFDLPLKGAVIETMVLGEDGTPLGKARPLHIGPQESWPPVYSDLEAAWDGSSFLLAWTERVQDTLTIRYQHLDGNGFPIEGAPIELEPAGAVKFSPFLAPAPSGVTVGFEMIAGGAAGDVGRAFTTTIDRLQPRHRPSG